MNKGRACLTCKHVWFKAPDDWKPAYDGAEYDAYHVVRIIRKTEYDVQGQCTLDPVWVPVTSSHYCGRWSGEKTITSARDFIWGSTLRREIDYQRDEIKMLKKKLENTRRVSASRLARLKPK